MSVPNEICILVVEDEALLLDIISTEIEDEGFTVIKAITAEAALEVLKSDAIVDLLFTDIRLPGPMNGFRLAEKAQQLRQDLPILYATGFTDEAPKGIESSCFFTKPYRISAVLTKIKAEVAPDQPGM